jgi:D-amino-acid dehydrogenase
MAALLELNSGTLELFDELRQAGVAFEMHRAGLIFAARSNAGMSAYREYFDALIAGGYCGRIEVWDRDEARAREPAFTEDLAGAFYARDERHVRPETLMRGLTEALRKEGVEVMEQAPVQEIFRRRGKWLIRTLGDTREADRVIVAAGVWSSALTRPLGVRLPLQAAKGYSITATGIGTAPRHPLYLAEARIGCSPFTDAVRIAGTLELAGLDIGVDRVRIDALLRTTALYLHDWRPREPQLEWAGLRPLAPDGLPLIGAVPGQDGLFVATGHGMLGVTLAPATAALLTACVLDGQFRPELAPFRPERFARRYRRGGTFSRNSSSLRGLRTRRG